MDPLTPDDRLAALTPAPWDVSADGESIVCVPRRSVLVRAVSANEQDMNLLAAARDLLEALHEGRRAIGDHFSPNDCYATGPITGDAIRDLVQCPACCFIAMYDEAIAKVTGAEA